MDAHQRRLFPRNPPVHQRHSRLRGRHALHAANRKRPKPRRQPRLRHNPRAPRSPLSAAPRASRTAWSQFSFHHESNIITAASLRTPACAGGCSGRVAGNPRSQFVSSRPGGKPSARHGTPQDSLLQVPADCFGSQKAGIVKACCWHCCAGLNSVAFLAPSDPDIYVQITTRPPNSADAAVLSAGAIRPSIPIPPGPQRADRGTLAPARSTAAAWRMRVYMASRCCHSSRL